MAGDLTARRGDASGPAAGDRRPIAQWLLSAMFVCFLALKCVEGVLGIETWPLPTCCP